VDIERRRPGAGPLLIAISAPLALFALAYTLWAISDRLLYIGPLDRAAFGWIVVVPITCAAPGIAGLIWARFAIGARLVAAVTVGGAIAVVSGVLLALAADYVDCAPVSSWTDSLPRAMTVGAIIGIVTAVSALAAASVASGLTGVRRILAATAVGGFIAFFGLFLAMITFGMVFPALSCAPVPS